ncbi:hypothetical protein [Demequina lignilytica]|uniref:Uncharacterized protein n=1 Tax=Demequina lignilytica TaxID=3051663 RepID=A0AB35MDV4_9MICO|nr:hypothetical protein [Demequina sp. SYSU T0a273]MDN4481940.1 hypothetical protein [Demequina sp. SYSU T0a273]
MSTTETRGGRRVVQVLSWVLGAIAAAATLWLLFLLLVIASEWSGYVGHESSTALAILATVGVVPAVLAWIGFAIVRILARRGTRPPADGDGA